MSDENTTQGSGSQAPGNESANTIPPAQTPPSNNSPASTPPPNAPDLAPLITALTALPETIAKSVKEAVGTPAKPQAQQESKPAESKPEESKPAETANSAPKGNAPGETRGTSTADRFRKWWFEG